MQRCSDLVFGLGGLAIFEKNYVMRRTKGWSLQEKRERPLIRMYLLLYLFWGVFQSRNDITETRAYAWAVKGLIVFYTFVLLKGCHVF